MTLMYLCKTFEGLSVQVPLDNRSARFFIGLTQASMFPGVRFCLIAFWATNEHAQVVFYLSELYRRRDVVLRNCA